MGVSYNQKFEIAQLVRSRGTTSRLEVSKATGVALPTISTLVRDLIRRRIITEDGYGESAGGRKPAQLRVNPDFAAAIGVEVSTRRVAALHVDAVGNVLARETATMPDDYDRESVLERLFHVLDALLSASPTSHLRGIGVGVSGIVDGDGRVSRELPLADGWKDVPLAQIVEERTGYPTELLNLVHAATLGEVRFGGAKSVRDMVFLHVGRGVAVGLMIGGALCRGADGNAGEFGHTVVREDAPLCYCGNHGCLESLASPKAIVEQCRDGVARGVRSSLAEIDSEAIGFQHILEHAKAGDKLAIHTVEDAGQHIGRQLANLINVLNPDVLMLGGLLARDADVLTESIRRAFRSRVLPLLRDATQIQLSQLREEASAMGAAAAVFDRLFSTPESLLGAPKRRAKKQSKA